jgi:hypothetical protein
MCIIGQTGLATSFRQRLAFVALGEHDQSVRHIPSLPTELPLNPIFMLGGAEAHEVSSKRLGSRFCSSPKLCPEAFPIKAGDHPPRNAP